VDTKSGHGAGKPTAKVVGFLYIIGRIQGFGWRKSPLFFPAESIRQGVDLLNENADPNKTFCEILLKVALNTITSPK
jgi:hypothetical protein